MRVLWTLLKLAIALAIIVPLGIIGASIALGLLGAMVGLSFVVIRIAILGLIVYGVFRLGAGLLGWRSPKRTSAVAPQLPPVDPYYESALRDLEREMGERPLR